MADEARYAILAKTHYWSETVANRFASVAEAAPGGDFFIFVDETNGPIDVDAERVIRCCRTDLAAHGLPSLPDGNPFWYNTDYPLFLAAGSLIGYDYVLMLEHDCGVTVDIDEMVARARSEHLDLVAQPIDLGITDWIWAPSLNGPYHPEDWKAALTCTMLISRPAWMHLFTKRLRLALQYADGTLEACKAPIPGPISGGVIEGWPFSEGFVPTELAQAGFKVAPLSDFGSVERYRWWPPCLDDAVAAEPYRGFSHPLLEEARYIESYLRLHPNPASWFDKADPLRAGLDQCERTLVLPRLNNALVGRHQTYALKLLRQETSDAEWVALGLGFNRVSMSPSRHNKADESTIYWQIDLGSIMDLAELRLSPPEVGVGGQVGVLVSTDEETWQEVGRIDLGSGATDGALRRLAPDLQRARYVRLVLEGGETMRTGPLQVFAE